jgi:hypothetical protein
MILASPTDKSAQSAATPWRRLRTAIVAFVTGPFVLRRFYHDSEGNDSPSARNNIALAPPGNHPGRRGVHRPSLADSLQGWSCDQLIASLAFFGLAGGFLKQVGRSFGNTWRDINRPIWR